MYIIWLYYIVYERQGVWNHRQYDPLFNSLPWLTAKKAPKFRIIGPLCVRRYMHNYYAPYKNRAYFHKIWLWAYGGFPL